MVWLVRDISANDMFFVCVKVGILNGFGIAHFLCTYEGCMYECMHPLFLIRDRREASHGRC